MDKKVLKAKWNRSVEIVERSFDKFKLNLYSYGFSDISDDGGLTLLLEVGVDYGEELEDDVEIKINFYDEDGIIVYSQDEDIYKDDFSGYDTLRVTFYEKDLAFEADSCRIFATTIF